MTKLTDNQKSVLHWMRRENIGAILFDGGYKFPEAFRRDAALADKFIERGLVGRFEAEVIR